MASLERLRFRRCFFFPVFSFSLSYRKYFVKICRTMKMQFVKIYRLILSNRPAGLIAGLKCQFTILPNSDPSYLPFNRVTNAFPFFFKRLNYSCQKNARKGKIKKDRKKLTSNRSLPYWLIIMWSQGASKKIPPSPPVERPARLFQNSSPYWLLSPFRIHAKIKSVRDGY